MRSDVWTLGVIRLLYENDYTLKTTKEHYPHTHDFCELYFHVAGKCTYMVENGIYPTDYGTCVITRNNELHSVRIEEDCQYERFYYYIKDGALPFLGSGAHMRCFFDRDFGQNNVIVLPRELMDECLARAKETVSVYESGEPDAESVGLANFLLTMHSINRFYNQALSLSEDKRYDSLVTNALRYINQNLTSIGKVDELAEKLFVSREYLSRTFKAQVGISPKQYIIMKRIETAKIALRGGASLDAACELSGFNDYSYFIYIFRRETGMTPAKYREYMSQSICVPMTDPTARPDDTSR